MKAILVIDIPDTKDNEDVRLNLVGANDIKAEAFIYTDESRTPIETRLFKDIKVKPLPTYRGGSRWADGWNACIDKIIGKVDL